MSTVGFTESYWDHKEHKHMPTGWVGILTSEQIASYEEFGLRPLGPGAHAGGGPVLS